MPTAAHGHPRNPLAAAVHFRSFRTTAAATTYRPSLAISITPTAVPRMQGKRPAITHKNNICSRKDSCDTELRKSILVSIATDTCAMRVDSTVQHCGRVSSQRGRSKHWLARVSMFICRSILRCLTSLPPPRTSGECNAGDVFTARSDGGGKSVGREGVNESEGEGRGRVITV